MAVDLKVAGAKGLATSQYSPRSAALHRGSAVWLRIVCRVHPRNRHKRAAGHRDRARQSRCPMQSIPLIRQLGDIHCDPQRLIFAERRRQLPSPQPSELCDDQFKNSKVAVSRLYMAPTILMVPLASRSDSTALFLRTLSSVIWTFVRATASTKE